MAESTNSSLNGTLPFSDRQFEEWWNEAFPINAINVERHNERKSLFGMLGPQDVISFLKSPAGKTSKAQLIEKINQNIALKTEQAIQRRDEERFKKQALALLLLSMTYEEAKAQNLNEALEVAIEKRLDDLEKARQEASARQQEVYTISFENELAEIEALDERQHQLDDQEKAMETRYANYYQGIEKSESIESIDAIEEELNKLDERIHENTVEAQQLLESRDEEKEKQARQLLDQTTAHHLAKAALIEQREVLSKEKICCNARGEVVTSLREATFIIPTNVHDGLKRNEQCLVEHEGEHYLLKKGQRINELSSNEKATSREEAKALKSHQYTPIRQLVRENQAREREEHRNKQQQLAQAREKQLQRLVDAVKQVQQANRVMAAFSPAMKPPAAPGKRQNKHEEPVAPMTPRSRL